MLLPNQSGHEHASKSKPANWPERRRSRWRFKVRRLRPGDPRGRERIADPRSDAPRPVRCIPAPHPSAVAAGVLVDVGSPMSPTLAPRAGYLIDFGAGDAPWLLSGRGCPHHLADANGVQRWGAERAFKRASNGPAQTLLPCSPFRPTPCYRARVGRESSVPELSDWLLGPRYATPLLVMPGLSCRRRH
jgi:hypothetical protein